MLKTLRLSFALRNTYRVNTILHALKQIPLIKHLFPATLYCSGGLKTFANVLSVIWEVLSIFLGKLLYFFLMIVGVGELYGQGMGSRLFLHMLLFLSVAGAWINTYIFNPTKDKYYALILMRMDSRKYALVNYFYALAKVLIGFSLCGILFGRMYDLPIWQCLLIPFFVAGIKLTVAAVGLVRIEKTGTPFNENKLGKAKWIALAVVLLMAYALPVLPFLLPEQLSLAFMVLCVLTGLISLRKVITFQHYRSAYREMLIDNMAQVNKSKLAAKEQSRRYIAADASITSNKRGFEYLNDLFVKRHRKLLWQASITITWVCLGIVCAVLIFFFFAPDERASVNEMLMTFLPYFTFIMYAINRGTNFTSALFINCDHSLLTYAFYKQPRFILRLFWIRLREIIKVNLLPAAVIGGGLALILYASGGTENPMDYVVMVVSILCMSVFFSLHYLTIYYLMQPYTAGTELKNGTYRIVVYITYFVCYAMMQVRLPTMVFGIATIVFTLVYCLVASVLVFRYAPKTFRLRA